MLSGQVQSRFKNEKALEPEAIDDLQRLLDETAPGYKVKNHKAVSGLTFFEMKHMKWDRLVLVPEVWCFLVVGEDPNNASGCIAAMRLATRNGVRNGKAITTHGSRLKDTRGGIPIVAWCDAFQFKRTYTRGGKITRSYTALQKVRVRYCRRLLELFAAQDSFGNQDWQKVQDIIDEYQDLLHLNGIPRRPNDGYRPKNVPQPNNANGTQDQDQNPGPDNDDDSDSDSDSDDNDDHCDHYSTATASFSRSQSRRTNPGHDDDLFDLGQDLDDVEDRPETENGIVVVENDDDEDPMDSYDDSSRSPLFVPRSRSVSPQADATQPEYDDEDFDMDIDFPTTLASSFRNEVRHASPNARTTTSREPNRLGTMINPVDMTEDSDDGDDDDIIILDREVKLDPTENWDLVGGGLQFVKTVQEVIEIDSDMTEDESNISEDTPEVIGDDSDVVIIGSVMQVIEIDDD